MVVIRYVIGSKPHENKFQSVNEFIEWFKKNYNLKIISFLADNYSSIELKDLNLTRITPSTELMKVQEENIEFEKAVFEALCNRNSETNKHAIEEFWDKVQSSLSYLTLTLGIKADKVMDHYPYHLEKIKNRPR